MTANDKVQQSASSSSLLLKVKGFFLICLLVIPVFCQSPTAETESSTDEQDHTQRSPAEEGLQSCKRKRTPSEEDLDIDGIHRFAIIHSCYSRCPSSVKEGLDPVPLYIKSGNVSASLLHQNQPDTHRKLFPFPSNRLPAGEQDQDHRES